MEKLKAPAGSSVLLLFVICINYSSSLKILFRPGRDVLATRRIFTSHFVARRSSLAPSVYQRLSYLISEMNQ